MAIDARSAGQAEPRTARGRRRIGLHSLLVGALTRHREELELLGLHEDEGFVFCTRNATPISLSSLRRGFKALCEQAGLGREWTTYELRHSFTPIRGYRRTRVRHRSTLPGVPDTPNGRLSPFCN